VAEEETKEFSAKVPVTEYETFKKNFPQYGAVNWFINTALASFNRQVRKNPSSVELIDEAVKDMLTERREVPTT
jgi:hypothetical protein